MDEDDLPFTDPMYIQYVNLEAANAATENEDSAPTHRRVHNLLTGVVEYKELVAVITRGGNGVRPKGTQDPNQVYNTNSRKGVNY